MSIVEINVNLIAETDLAFLVNDGTEDDENYYGMWVLGYGFVNVRFPKDTTRELTNEEVIYWNSKSIQIGSQIPHKLKED